MKAALLFAVGVFLGWSSDGEAQEIYIDLKPALQSRGIEHEIVSAIRSSKFSHGHVSAELRSAGLSFVRGSHTIPGKVHIWVENKQKTCIYIPFAGKKCHFWTGMRTNFGVDFRIAEGCTVRDVHLSKWGTDCWGPTCAATAIGHEVLKVVRGSLEGKIKSNIENALKGKVPGC